MHGRRLCRLLATLLLACSLVWPRTSGAAFPWHTAAEAGSAPKWILHEGSWQGYCPELFAALQQLDPELRVSVAPAAMPQKRLETALLERQVQVICTLTRVPLREPRFGFVHPPLYRMTYALAARAEDPVDIQSWDDVRRLGPDGSILLNHDSSRVQVLAALGGLQLRTGGVNTETNLRMLLAGRGRFFYFPRANLLAAAQQMGVQDRIRLLMPDPEAQPYHLLIHPQTPPGERERLERALATLEQMGVLHRLAERWNLE